MTQQSRNQVVPVGRLGTLDEIANALALDFV